LSLAENVTTTRAGREICERILSELFSGKNAYLASVLLSFFDFDVVQNRLNLVSKAFRCLVTNEERLDKIIWKQLFLEEFLYLEYSDHQKLPMESYRAYFIRSFQHYKTMRKLIEGIIDETNLRRV
jgi:hypothetical protein